MATDNVQIANMALDLIGSRYIAAMNEASKEARACNRNYDLSRKAVLRDHPWNFATKRVALDTADGTPPVFGYENRFALPSDFIRVHTIYYTDGTVVDQGSYKIEAGFILTDESVLWLRYVYDLQTTTAFDPLFDEALAAYLAWKISYLISASESRQQQLYQAYLVQIQKAKFTDTVEEPSRQFDDDEWIRSRFSARGNFVRDPKTN